MLDLATANYLSEDVSVRLGNGDGTYQPAQNYATNASDFGPTCIVAGDFNGDGNLDLVTGNQTASVTSVQRDRVCSWATAMAASSGTLTFIGAVNLPGSFPRDMVVGDFDADGKLDLAVAIVTIQTTWVTFTCCWAPGKEPLQRDNCPRSFRRLRRHFHGHGRLQPRRQVGPGMEQSRSRRH